jgi:FMN phosphatase YigB (HAD superfamily)
VFLHVCAEFNKEPSDVWFIGNNLKKDVHGASDAGLNAIFYNRANDEYGGYSVKDLLEVRDIVR